MRQQAAVVQREHTSRWCGVAAAAAAAAVAVAVASGEQQQHKALCGLHMVERRLACWLQCWLQCHVIEERGHT